MTAKEFLEQARFVDRAIDSKLEQVHRLREEATKATSLLADMPSSSSPNLQRMEATIVKIIDLEHEINRDIDWLVDLKKAARRSINALASPEERLILELRYLCYKSWQEISERLGCGESNVYRLHGLALANFTVPPDPGDRDWNRTEA